MNPHLLMVSLFLMSAVSAFSQSVVSVTVDPVSVLNPINPWLYGLNTARWDESLFPEPSKDMLLTCDRDAIEKVRAAGITLLKYPGGNDADAYIWNSPDNNASEMDTDEYINFCRAVGAEPFITVNFNASATLAADWVRYCNVQRGYGVKLWEVGDEQWGTWAKGHAPPEEYAKKYRSFVRAMKAVDPRIKVATNVPLGSHPENWTERVLRAAGDDVDMITFTFFPQQWGKEDDDTLLASIDTFCRLVTALNEEVERVVGARRAKEILLINVGYNSVNHSPGPQTLRMVNALWTTAMVGTMAETGVDVGCFWALHNAYPPRNGDYGILSSEGSNTPSYSYYVFPFLSRRFENQCVRTTSSDPTLRTFASRSGKRVNLVLLNCHPKSTKSVTIALGTFVPDKTVRTSVLDQWRRNAESPSLMMEGGQLLCEVQPYSVTMVEFLGADSVTPAPNLALSGEATASSYSITGPNFSPRNAIDGKLHTRWNSAAWTKSGGEEAQWLQVMWADTQHISRVTICWGESPALDYRIELSLDGVRWMTAKEITGGKGGEEVFEFSVVPTRYVRVNGTRGTRGISSFSIRELEIY